MVLVRSSVRLVGWQAAGPTLCRVCSALLTLHRRQAVKAVPGERHRSTRFKRTDTLGTEECSLPPTARHVSLVPVCVFVPSNVLLLLLLLLHHVVELKTGKFIAAFNLVQLVCDLIPRTTFAKLSVSHSPVMQQPAARLLHTPLVILSRAGR